MFDKYHICFFITFFCLTHTATYSQTKSHLQIAKFNKNVDLPLSNQERLFIDEVYGKYANKYVYTDELQLKNIKQILRNRVLITKNLSPKRVKNFSKLSEVALFNSFNSNLQSDKVFNPETFNPLKYLFEFYSKSSFTYKVDDTEYYIIVKSQYQK